jgi:hypothetical protein
LMDRYVITIIYEAYLLMKMSYLGTDLWDASLTVR